MHMPQLRHRLGSQDKHSVFHKLLKQLFLPYISGLKFLRNGQKPSLQCWIHRCMQDTSQGPKWLLSQLSPKA